MKCHILFRAFSSEQSPPRVNSVQLFAAVLGSEFLAKFPVIASQIDLDLRKEHRVFPTQRASIASNFSHAFFDCHIFSRAQVPRSTEEHHTAFSGAGRRNGIFFKFPRMGESVHWYFYFASKKGSWNFENRCEDWSMRISKRALRKIQVTLVWQFFVSLFPNA